MDEVDAWKASALAPLQRSRPQRGSRVRIAVRNELGFAWMAVLAFLQRSPVSPLVATLAISSAVFLHELGRALSRTGASCKQCCRSYARAECSWFEVCG